MRDDQRRRSENRKHNLALEASKSADPNDLSHGRFVMWSAEDMAKLKSEYSGWPTCDNETCPKPAEIVCPSPKWERDGFHDNEEETLQEAIFCCREHTTRTEIWPWFWMIPAADRDDDAPTIQEFDTLVHLSEKTWGVPFIAWLLENYSLYPPGHQYAPWVSKN